MRLLAFGLIFVLPLTTMAAEPDQKSLQGVWQLQEAELAGKPFPEEVRKAIKLTVKDDKYEVTAGKELDQGSLKLNGAAKPKEMDIIGTDGPNKGKTILAIYEQEGDTLRVCYDLTGTKRPTEFKSSEGTLIFLAKYMREQK